MLACDECGEKLLMIVLSQSLVDPGGLSGIERTPLLLIEQ